jgi:hypothetical protein
MYIRMYITGVICNAPFVLPKMYFLNHFKCTLYMYLTKYITYLHNHVHLMYILKVIKCTFTFKCTFTYYLLMYIIRYLKCTSQVYIPMCFTMYIF